MISSSSASSSSSSSESESEAADVRSYGDDASHEATKKVTRSIMIVKPPGYQSASPPVSPAGSATPGSPFSGKIDPTFFFQASNLT